MKRVVLAAALALTGCANIPRLDLCKGSDVRRQVYTTTIAASDTFIASGQPVPQAVRLGREAAVTALILLNEHCPAVASAT